MKGFKKMKSKTKLFIVTFAVFGVLFGFSTKTLAQSKIALVDMVQIVHNYDKAKQAQAELQANQAELNKMITNARQEVKKIKGENKKKEREKTLTENIMNKSKLFRENFSKKWQQVQSDVLVTIKQVADREKFDLVMDKQTVIAGGEDITQKVLAELKK